jgi:hypothetical protein
VDALFDLARTFTDVGCYPLIVHGHEARTHCQGIGQRVVLAQTSGSCEFFKTFLLCLVGSNVAHQCVDALVMDVVPETVPGSVQP